MEHEFNLFESKVLPLLSKHNGKLLYRVRPTQSCVIATAMDHPYELHLITFAARHDFEAYCNDKERLQHIQLKEASVERSILIEGAVI